MGSRASSRSFSAASWAVPRLSPLVSVLPVQKLAVALTYARGLDPDNPRGLPQKVVRTL